MSKSFDINSILQLQTLAFPLIKMVGGPDIGEDILQPTSAHLYRAGDVLKQSSDVLLAASAALADGRLEMSEIDIIVEEAGEVQDALQRLLHPSGEEKAEPAGDS